ncbi:MAG: hypothetical protein QXU20_01165 [Candidatus Woesearchaeota archaeon]
MSNDKKTIPIEKQIELTKKNLEGEKNFLSNVYGEILKEPLFGYDLKNSGVEKEFNELVPYVSLEKILQKELKLYSGNDSWAFNQLGLSILLKLEHLADKYKVNRQNIKYLFFSKTLNKMEEYLENNNVKEANKYARIALSIYYNHRYLANYKTDNESRDYFDKFTNMILRKANNPELNKKYREGLLSFVEMIYNGTFSKIGEWTWDEHKKYEQIIFLKGEQ